MPNRVPLILPTASCPHGKALCLEHSPIEQLLIGRALLLITKIGAKPEAKLWQDGDTVIARIEWSGFSGYQLGNPGPCALLTAGGIGGRGESVRHAALNLCINIEMLLGDLADAPAARDPSAARTP